MRSDFSLEIVKNNFVGWHLIIQMHQREIDNNEVYELLYTSNKHHWVYYTINTVCFIIQ